MSLHTFFCITEVYHKLCVRKMHLIMALVQFYSKSKIKYSLSSDITDFLYQFET